MVGWKDRQLTSTSFLQHWSLQSKKLSTDQWLDHAHASKPHYHTWWVGGGWDSSESLWPPGILFYTLATCMIQGMSHLIINNLVKGHLDENHFM